jgi:hypothetical protein
MNERSRNEFTVGDAGAKNKLLRPGKTRIKQEEAVADKQDVPQNGTNDLRESCLSRKGLLHDDLSREDRTAIAFPVDGRRSDEGGSQSVC